MKRDTHISHEVYFGENKETSRPFISIKLDETGIRIVGLTPNEENGEIELCLDKEELSVLIKVLQDYEKD